MSHSLAVIGVGNMAKAILAGIRNSSFPVKEIFVFDTNKSQYQDLPTNGISLFYADSVADAVSNADCILLSVKPQNFPDLLQEIRAVPTYADKLYVSIAAGIPSGQISAQLGNACVIRVLPNVPMLIGNGVSLVCKTPNASVEDFDWICSMFRCAGNVICIDEQDMNPMIGVTSSSPAYVFQFINAIYQGALNQQLPDNNLLEAICDVVIGSAMLLKSSSDSPQELITKVASKGGTTERALAVLEEHGFDHIILDAMLACTNRADELGAQNS